MRKIAHISAALLLGLLFAACDSGQEIPQPADKTVEIAFNIDNYTKVITNMKSASSAAATRATDVGTAQESEVKDFYIFLFRENTQQLIGKYYVANAAADGSVTGGTGGTYVVAEKKASLNLTQAEAGKCDVYIVANATDNDVKATLDGITATTANPLDAVKSVSRSVNTPWSATLSTPILMSGYKNHDFISDRQLDHVNLVRALAKVELKITLKAEHQSTPVVREGDFSDPSAILINKPQYHYAFLNFDQRTYALKPASKESLLTAPNAVADLRNPATGGWSWSVWNTLGTYLPEGATDNTNVTGLNLVTYINERVPEVPAKPLSAIGIKMPYNGPTPPPEFGPDVTQIFLPTTIARNNWYVYNVEL